MSAKCTAEQFPLIYKGGNVVQLERLSHRHLAIMDYMLANPQEKMGSVAAYFRVTPAWLSTVVNSDLFKNRFADRRAAMETYQQASLSQKLFEIAEDGLGAIHDSVRDSEVDPKTKLDASRLALEAMGILGKGGGGIGVQVNVASPPDPHAVDPSHLHQARARMQGARREEPIAEGKVIEDSGE